MAMRRTATGLLIPIRMNEEARFDCSFCDWRGYSEREQVLHIKEHIREDEAEIMEMTKPRLEGVLAEDPERQEHLRRRHRQLVKEVGPKEALDPKRY